MISFGEVAMIFESWWQQIYLSAGGFFAPHALPLGVSAVIFFSMVVMRLDTEPQMEAREQRLLDFGIMITAVLLGVVLYITGAYIGYVKDIEMARM